MFTFPGGVLNAQNDDILVWLVDGVVDEIVVLPRDQLSHPFDGLWSADVRKAYTSEGNEGWPRARAARHSDCARGCIRRCLSGLA